jgi:aldehyde dehydrogenase (NAD(P)+)
MITETSRADLDAALTTLRDRARAFARLPPAEKAALLRACIPRLAEVAPAWADAGARAKGLAPDDAEEWLAGPLVTIRSARLLADSLDAIARSGRPPQGTGVRERRDGRVEIDVFPTSPMDRALFTGFRGHVLLQAGLGRTEAGRRQASFYRERDPEGGVALILGAGNVSSIPPTDAFTKMFVEGFVAIVKMNPVNAWAGPILERALAPLIERGYLRIVYGGGDVGAYLVEHEAVDDVHITGSDKTHDAIVWGPGAEGERRKASGEPRLTKPISSELGNVSPVAIVPYSYDDRELDFMAENVATMVANNGSFNCNAAKVLVTSADWAQRDAFLARLRGALRRLPSRRAYYPGAMDRYRTLTAGRDLETFGNATPERLPWTLIRNVDGANPADPLFRTEPFCAILSDVTLGSADPVEFLDRFTRFGNETLWGTLNAALVIHPRLEKDPTVGACLDRAILELRYGTVAVNHWPAIGYGTASLPWGGHPSATLKDVQSGLGWVHNSYMIEGIEKSVLRGPLRVFPTPPWFVGNRRGLKVAQRLVALEAEPRWTRVPAVALAALWG